MAQKITIADIAKELRITPGTVSRALSDHPKISTETKLAVSTLAAKLNYRRNRIASSLRSGKSHVIGVMIPSAEINFFGSVVHGIESIANSYGYNVLIYQSNESHEFEARGIETFLSAGVDGILASIAKNTHDFTHYTEAKQRGIPLVFFDRTNDRLHVPSVVTNDHKGAYMATEHLIRQGFQRIAHIAGPQHLKIFNDRLKGYLSALQANKIKVNNELIYQGDVSIASGKSAVEYFLQLGKKPDAIFAVEDFTALGVIKALKEKQVNIPGEMGVIGFANELFGEHITPSLSTIDQQTVLMGQEAVKLLLQLCGETEQTTVTERHIILEPIPIFRDSSVRNREKG